MDKFFLPLHGMLMEVTEETYKEYYRDKRRQKYIDERSKAHGDISYNSFDTDEFLGEDILVDKRIDVEAQVISKMTVEKLQKAFLLLSPDEKALQTIKNQRNTQKLTNRNDGIFQLPIAVKCPVCGDIIKRRCSRRKKGYSQWRCKNSECDNTINKNDDELLSDIIKLLNTVIDISN